MHALAILAAALSVGTSAFPLTTSPTPRGDRDEAVVYADVYADKVTHSDRDEGVVYADVYSEKVARSDRDEAVIYADVYADKAVRSNHDGNE